MNQIKRSPINTLGYNFITAEPLPKGKDEYYLRNKQNKNGIKYRGLTAYEIEVLVRNRNTSDDWNKILVSDAFTPELVQNCKFFGLVRIGKLEPFYLEFHNLRRPVGLYNSTIISCDFGDNCVVDNVNYLSHFILGSEVILVNINEIATTEYAKFGNGILKVGEDPKRRIWMEICNENAGRSIIPFDGMLPGDAYLWTRFRDNEALQQKFIEFTDHRFDLHRGFYGTVGDRTVIKNCKMLKDVKIGSDAYIKGANKIKNVTINSSPDALTQIGEGCELVNGIVGYGCRIFYGVKAVRFVMASHSQLKYGARLLNSYLGNNSTISCCEVLNSLIFPAHEQHHNNSFLCAALVGGQSNMAAGATVGSNHNSRSPDGEIIAGRGFWPGLCVSLKHNSKFASFTILAKGDYPAELNITLPFSLISNDTTKDELVIMPAYWFQYNMYALARNAWKYLDRDKRIDRKQLIEYNYLAPDSIADILTALPVLEEAVGRAYVASKSLKGPKTPEDFRKIGAEQLALQSTELDTLEFTISGAERTSRKAVVLKLPKAYRIYKNLVRHHAALNLIDWIEQQQIKSHEQLQASMPARLQVEEWQNIGGQMIPKKEIQKLIKAITSGKVKNWDAVHHFYEEKGREYPREKAIHAFGALKISEGIDLRKADRSTITALLQEAVGTKKWMADGIHGSRAKDYQNEFRKMVYESDAEMNKVLGALKSNSFINQEFKQLQVFNARVESILQELK